MYKFFIPASGLVPLNIVERAVAEAKRQGITMLEVEQVSDSVMQVMNQLAKEKADALSNQRPG